MKRRSRLFTGTIEDSMAKEITLIKTIKPHYLNQLLITWIAKTNFEGEGAGGRERIKKYNDSKCIAKFGFLGSPSTYTKSSHRPDATCQRDAIFRFLKANKTINGKKFGYICAPNSLNC